MSTGFYEYVLTFQVATDASEPEMTTIDTPLPLI